VVEEVAEEVAEEDDDDDLHRSNRPSPWTSAPPSPQTAITNHYHRPGHTYLNRIHYNRATTTHHHLPQFTSINKPLNKSWHPYYQHESAPGDNPTQRCSSARYNHNLSCNLPRLPLGNTDSAHTSTETEKTAMKAEFVHSPRLGRGKGNPDATRSSASPSDNH